MKRSNFPTFLNEMNKKVLPTVVNNVFTSYGFDFNEMDVEDTVSEAILKILSNFEKYDETKSSKSWFTTIAKNCALDFMKAQAKRNSRFCRYESTINEDGILEYQYSNDKDDAYYNPDEQLFSKERFEIIQKGINSLNGKGQVALTMKSQDYSNEEISEALGVNDGACRTIISRARKELCQNLNIQHIWSSLRECA